MKYLLLSLSLFLAGCVTGGESPIFMSGFCLENPAAGIPNGCQSIQQVNAGDL
jgi:hypothetical protein